MSFILLGILNSQASGASIRYWLATMGGASNDAGFGVAVDSSNNYYSAGRSASTGAGGDDLYLMKRSKAGEVLWQRVLGGASSDAAIAVAIDSADNVYVTGYTNSTGAGNNDLLLAKYNSSGTIQWQRVLGGVNSDLGQGVAIDSGDNVYLVGDTGDGDLLIAKYNSSGTLQWQRDLGGAYSEEGDFIAVDSSGNLYVTGRTSSAGAGNNDLLLAKYNSSGTIQWQRVLGGSGSDVGLGVAIDSEDNVYVTGANESSGEGSAEFLLAKYNSSGTIQWQRGLGGVSEDLAFAVTTDSNNNVYVCGRTVSSGEGGYDFLIAKYNSSGTIQWQRVLGGSGSDVAFSMVVDSEDALQILGVTSSTGAGSDDLLLAKLPNNGSLTGTYVLDGVNIVYSASSLTAYTTTLTAATSSLSSATSTLTASTSSLTDSSASLTNHFVEIPA